MKLRVLRVLLSTFALVACGTRPQAGSYESVIGTEIRGLGSLSVGGSADWIFSPLGWTDTAMSGVLRMTRAELIRFPGGIFGNVFSLARDSLVESLQMSAGYRSRYQAYRLRLRNSAIDVHEMLRRVEQSEASVVWVLSPFDPLVDSSFRRILTLTPRGDSARIELGNELYDGWFVGRPVSPVELIALRERLILSAEQMGRTVSIALPFSHSGMSTRNPDWDAVVGAVSDAPLAIHIYVGEPSWQCGSCSFEGAMHSMQSRLENVAQNHTLWVTELNVDARADSIRVDDVWVKLGTRRHALVVASALLHLATIQRLEVILLHALVEDGPYGIFTGRTAGADSESAVRFELELLPRIVRMLSDGATIRECPVSRGSASQRSQFEVCESAACQIVSISVKDDFLSIDEGAAVVCGQ